MGISYSGEFNEVDGANYVSAAVTATTSQIQAKVGGSNLTGRQNLVLFNKGTVTVYIGPTGVSSTNGIPLEPSQFFSYPFGDAINVFLITASGSASVIVQESA